MLYTEDFSMRHYVRFSQIGSHIVLGHYPVTNSNGMRLKLNYDLIVAKL